MWLPSLYTCPLHSAWFYANYNRLRPHTRRARAIRRMAQDARVILIVFVITSFPGPTSQGKALFLSFGRWGLGTRLVCYTVVARWCCILKWLYRQQWQRFGDAVYKRCFDNLYYIARIYGGPYLLCLYITYLVVFVLAFSSCHEHYQYVINT